VEALFVWGTESEKNQKCHFLNFGKDLTKFRWSENSILVCQNLQFQTAPPPLRPWGEILPLSITCISWVQKAKFRTNICDFPHHITLYVAMHPHVTYFIILLCLKADFQSSHEAPRSELRVLASN
jgi:hypothetical protein